MALVASRTSAPPIVVGTDGSPSSRAAVARAMELAAERGAPLHLVCAYTSVQPGGALVGQAIHDDDAVARAERCLAEAAAEARAKGLACETFAIAGSAASALVDVAATQQAACLVVGSRGMHGARRLLGSVPNAVSHQAACDVLIVRTD